MSTSDLIMEPALEAETRAPAVDTRLELVVIPVSDVARAKAFYTGLGWRLDAEFGDGEGFEVVQVTPPGSPASIIFGSNVTSAQPGSAQGLYLIVSDIEAARADLIRRGADVSEPFHGAGGVYAGADAPFLFGTHRVEGPDPDRGSYRSFASFEDPDGNGWLLQEITRRQPGRIDSHATTYVSVADLAAAMRRAENAHGAYELTLGHRDEAWANWYAAWMVAEQKGELPPG